MNTDHSDKMRIANQRQVKAMDSGSSKAAIQSEECDMVVQERTASPQLEFVKNWLAIRKKYFSDYCIHLAILSGC